MQLLQVQLRYTSSLAYPKTNNFVVSDLSISPREGESLNAEDEVVGREAARYVRFSSAAYGMLMLKVRDRRNGRDKSDGRLFSPPPPPPPYWYYIHDSIVIKVIYTAAIMLPCDGVFLLLECYSVRYFFSLQVLLI